MFSNGWHFISELPSKNQDWYEKILTDSKSIDVEHHIQNNLVSHSTVRILKVLTFSDWNQKMDQHKSFSKIESGQPPTYSYFDYIRAWYNTFYYQNSKMRHSWLIFFFQDKKYRFPHWFLNWFTVFGPIPEIFPENIKEGWDTFQSCFDNENRNFGQYPMLLQFFSRVGLPWAMYWEYKVQPLQTTPPGLVLQRQISVKWWGNFNQADRATKYGIMKWFEKSPQFHKSMKEGQSQYLQVRSQAVASISGASTKQDYKANLKQLLQQLSDSDSEETDEEQSLEFSQDMLQSNEDDCFGIDLQQEDEDPVSQT